MFTKRAWFHLQEAVIWGGGLTVAGSLYYIFFVSKGIEKTMRDSSAVKFLTVQRLISQESSAQGAGSTAAEPLR